MDNVGCNCDLIGHLRRHALHQTSFQSKEYEDSLRGKAVMSSSISDTKSTGSVGGLTKRQRDKEVTPASSNIRCCYFVSVTCYEGDMVALSSMIIRLQFVVLHIVVTAGSMASASARTRRRSASVM